MVNTMKEFSLSDLNRRTGELTDIAMAEPVFLHKRGRRVLVLMSIAEYEALTDGSGDGAQEAVNEARAAEASAPKTERRKLDGLKKATQADEEL